MKYIATSDSYGFMGRYWSEGDIVEVSGGQIVPRHFKPIGQTDVEVPKEAKPVVDVPQSQPAPAAAAPEPKKPNKRNMLK